MSDNATDLKEYSAGWWVKELDAAEKTLDDKWRRSARKVVDRYLDRRDDTDTLLVERRKYNIFWANIQILKAAHYATPPKPSVRRQHGDAKDDVARAAALMLQRMLMFSLQEDNSSEHEAFNQATENRLIPGLGQVWARYEVETKPIADPNGGEKPIGEQIVKEEALIDYVSWDDFYWSPARTWKEVWWVGKRVWLTKAKFTRRFGKEKYEQLKAEQAFQDPEKIYPDGFQKNRIETFELWCMETRKVYWIHRKLKLELDQRDDPLGLPSFWPCPKPILSTHTTNTLIPRPDYVMVQDQYEELDDLNNRIHLLTKALRVVGVYDAGDAELANILTGGELRMIPISNWGMFGEKGGFKGAVDWFPVDQVAKVLEGLIDQRPLVIQQIYELTSISDIMRGVSESRETAKAQTLKAQYSSVRLQLSQQEIARFVTEALQIKAQIICTHFQPQSIIEQSQIEQTESAQFAEQAVMLLKNAKAREYRISIADQSLSMADYNAERETRIEFITAIGQFVSQAQQIITVMPQAMPYILKMIQWVASSFRGSDDIESVLDEAIQALQANPLQPEDKNKPKGPTPEEEAMARKDEQSFEMAKLDKQHEQNKELKLMEREDDEMNAERDARFKALEAQMSQIQDLAKIELEGRAKEAGDTTNLMKSVVGAVQAMTEVMIETAKISAEAQGEATEALVDLTKSIGKKKRRVPVRDDAGDILYSEEQDVPEEQPTVQ